MSKKEDNIDPEQVSIPFLDNPTIITEATINVLNPLDNHDVEAILPEAKPKKKYVYPKAICHICGRELNNKYVLKQHLQRHEDNKPYNRIPQRDENGNLQFSDVHECMLYISKIAEDMEVVKSYLQSQTDGDKLINP